MRIINIVLLLLSLNSGIAKAVTPVDLCEKWLSPARIGTPLWAQRASAPLRALRQQWRTTLVKAVGYDIGSSEALFTNEARDRHLLPTHQVGALRDSMYPGAVPRSHQQVQLIKDGLIYFPVMSPPADLGINQEMGIETYFIFLEHFFDVIAVSTSETSKDVMWRFVSEKWLDDMYRQIDSETALNIATEVLDALHPELTAKFADAVDSLLKELRLRRFDFVNLATVVQMIERLPGWQYDKDVFVKTLTTLLENGDARERHFTAITQQRFLVGELYGLNLSSTWPISYRILGNGKVESIVKPSVINSLLAFHLRVQFQGMVSDPRGIHAVLDQIIRKFRGLGLTSSSTTEDLNQGP